MVDCPYCGREIPDDSKYCPYCGRERRFLRTNYDLPNSMNKEIIVTGGTISSYVASGSIAVYEAQVHPESALLNSGARYYQTYSPTITNQFAERIREGEEAVKNFDNEIKMRDRATEIVNLVCATNILFSAKKHARLFREDTPQTFTELYLPCLNHHDLVAKIASIACLFEVDLAPLRALLATPPPNDVGSIGLVELWLTTSALPFDTEMIGVWRNIRALRNIPPIHSGNHAQELMRALTFFGETYPINYSRLWETILEKFKFSLEEWQSILGQLHA